MVNPVTDNKYAIFEQDDRAFLAKIFAVYPKVEQNFEKYLALPMQERFLEGQRDMKRTPRKGLVEWGIWKPKTLDEHSKEVSDYAAKHAPKGLTQSHIRLMATLHDFPEVIITDFTPRDNISSSDKARLERLALKVLTDEQSIHEVVAEYTAKATPLAQWVSDADKLVMLTETLQYEAKYPRLKKESYYPPGVSPKVGMFNEFLAAHGKRIKTDAGKVLLNDLIEHADEYRKSYAKGGRVR